MHPRRGRSSVPAASPRAAVFVVQQDYRRVEEKESMHFAVQSSQIFLRMAIIENDVVDFEPGHKSGRVGKPESHPGEINSP